MNPEGRAEHVSTATDATSVAQTETVVRVSGLVTRLGGQVIHDQLDLEVARGEILGVVGGSGSGKSVLLRTLVGLIRPASGRVEVLGLDLATIGEPERARLRRRWGVLFQAGALFSELTVAENVEVPLRKHTGMPGTLRRELAAMKIEMVGLSPDAADKYPAELSGGMRKRAGLARALALDPALLFLDEPTAGLDPIGASEFDELIRDLQRALGLTVVMVTHDLDSLRTVCDRIAVLIDKRVRVGTLESLRRDSEPWIREYFGGPRGRAALGEARTGG